jgi:predicted DCC family thiol-disulfide oxidoreductase YuxK
MPLARSFLARDDDAVTSMFVYDGDCAFCTSCAEFIGRHGLGHRVHQRRPGQQVTVLPWQFADLDALGLTVAQAEHAVQWVGADGHRAAGPDAIAELLLASRPAWRALGWLLLRRPVRVLTWPVYRWVARNRHRLPGGTAACALPQAARQRLDGGT